MYQGKHGNAKARKGRRRYYIKGRMAAMILSTVLLLALAIGGTVAWLSTKDAPIQNKFLPTKVTCEVTENFNGKVKSNVNVENTGDTTAYIRVKLVTYRTNDAGQHIGGTASLPTFTLGTGWVKYGDYYYYTKPVAPNQKPGTNLTDSMTLTNTYKDADGGHQSIDVMAEAIQSQPATAVEDSWGVTVGQDGTIQ